MFVSLPKTKKNMISYFQNQIYLLKKNNMQYIIGIITNGLATFGSLIISFENDNYIIFTHFDETFQLLDEVNNKVNEIKFEEIKNIIVFYSQGNDPLFNQPLQEKKILENIDNLLKNNFKKSKKLEINYFIKKHDKPITCLKMLETVENSVIYFNEILNYFLNDFEKANNRFKKEIKNKIINIFEKERNETHNNYNVSYYFNEAQISKILEIFKISLLKINDLE